MHNLSFSTCCSRVEPFFNFCFLRSSYFFRPSRYSATASLEGFLSPGRTKEKKIYDTMTIQCRITVSHCRVYQSQFRPFTVYINRSGWLVNHLKTSEVKFHPKQNQNKIKNRTRYINISAPS